MMRARSLTAALAVAFGAMTLAVFALVGSYVYLQLDRQVSEQSDLDVVLAARHARRLAEELASAEDVRAHAERLSSVVFGNNALSFAAAAEDGRLLASRNLAITLPGDAAIATPRADMRDPDAGEDELAPKAASRAEAGAGAGLDTLGLAAIVPRGTPHVDPAARIVGKQIVAWATRGGMPVHGMVVDARLRDGTRVALMLARNLRDGRALLDRYRDTLWLAGGVGAALSMLVGYALIRLSLRPLRGVVADTGRITVDRLDTRLDAGRVPRELAPLVEAVNAMLARLQRGFRQLSQFSADLAHDLRTPLNNMRGATEVALGRPRTAAEYEALLESNLEEYERLSRMIENVLFLARAEHPGFVTHQRDFEVREELLRIAGYFEGLADEAGLQLRVEGGGRLSAELELFRRAIGNLLANALRYTPRGGEIRLAARESAEALTISVTNPGEPIAPELLERIFDRFYRADPARSRQAPGTGGVAGLGLAIVRSVMELHGGTAYAESDAGGTRFVLTFPRETSA
ncbi:heavy metal sensor histidine kinase [Burkholderia gladioli]|uniref:heavy metal sensor histidine kinase n=1 Tax=Burkholderia gladioli TaxID=28095 RepID=UPI0016419348|nr:heavy metal sensor histidine kinase [Burkholderia gladioli]